MQSGYGFVGWFTAPEGGEEVTARTVPSSSPALQTLYARWTASYLAVTFDSNGGAPLGTKGTKNVFFGSAYGPLPTPTSIGYTFTGWYTAAIDGDLVTELSTATTPEDHSLYAHWTANALTVNFDSLGGSVPAASSRTVTFNATYGALPAPNKPGYRFLGWYAQITGGSEVGSETIVTNPSTPQTLYARWAPNGYTVTFDPNGGVSLKTKGTKNVTFGDAYDTLPVPSYTGYVFLGWYTAATVGSLVTEADLVSDPSNHTLYAHWMADAVTVNFDSLGGLAPAPANTSVVFQGTYGALPVTTRAGYHFDGWFTTAAGGTEITPESTVTKSSSPQTLFAHWSPNSYTVSFDYQGGSGAERAATPVTFDKVYKTLPTPGLAGHTFTGWYTAPKDGDLVTSASTVAIPEDHTLYAHWTAHAVTVNFDTQGGTTPSPATLSFFFGEAYGELPSSSKQGYAFAGWQEQADSESTLTPTSSVTSPGKLATLSARWTPNSYTVSFDTQGGSDPTPASLSVSSGSTHGALPAPTKPGYTFAGWYTARIGGNLVTAASKATTFADHTLYARWAPISLVVSFDARQGKAVETTKVIAFNTPYGDLPESTYTGYRFDGWYTKADDSGTPATASTLVTDTNREQTLYAHWSPKNYTVTLDTQGGELESATATVTFTGTYGELPAPTKTGYTFAGWYSAADEDGTEILATTPVTDADDHSLYAHWTPNHYTVTFDSQEGTDPTPASLSVPFGGQYGALPTPTKPGYDFVDWHTTKTDGNLVTAASKVVIPEDHALYARWAPIPVVVSFDAQQGAVDETGKIVAFNTAIGDLPESTYTGYRFDGWYTEADDTGSPVTGSTLIVDVSGEQTLYAHWSPKDYAITLDTQGGELETSTATVTFTGTYGELPAPTKTGYTFAGWYSSADEDGTEILATTPVTDADDHSLYARWTPNQYTVTFDSQEGSDPIPASLSVSFGEQYGILPTTIKESYTLEGWFTSAVDGDLVAVETLVSSAEDHILYAHWVANEITLTFDVKGGNSLGAEGSRKVPFDSPYSDLPIPSAVGCAFVGWYTTDDETGTNVLVADSAPNARDHTLYARWTPNTYQVTFDAQTGSVVGPTTIGFSFGNTYGTLPVATKENYAFEGWFTAAEDGDLVTETSFVTSPNSYTLYAHWGANKIKVTFDAQGGADLGLYGSATLSYDSPYGELPTPTRAGYTFTGWFTTSTGWMLVSPNEDVVNPSDHSLYAHWKPNRYTVIFDTQKGAAVEPPTSSVTFGDEYGTLPVTTRQNYNFDGWYTEANEGMLIGGLSTVAIPRNHTLFAHWSPNKLTIAFDVQGGDTLPGSGTKTLPFNGTYGELPVPVKTGYSFMGWFTSTDRSGDAITAEDSIISVEDHVLYARWSANVLRRETQGYTPQDLFLGIDEVRRGQIKSLAFVDVAPTEGLLYDVSAEKHESVVAQVSGNSSTGYDIVIGSTGGVLANADSSNLFAGLAQLRSLDLSSFDGSQITNAGYMFAGSVLPDNLSFRPGFGAYILNMESMFNGAALPPGLTSFPAGFGSRARHLDNMFARATLSSELTLPSGFGAQATYLNFMFYGAILPPGLTSFPAGFGAQAEDLSAMFYGASLNADIDWSQTTFAHLSTLSLMGTFGGTIWNGHTIKVENAATQEKFLAALLP
jgi:uncharacterized repeat protein (TIGR02543 family)